MVKPAHYCNGKERKETRGCILFHNRPSSDQPITVLLWWACGRRGMKIQNNTYKVNTVHIMYMAVLQVTIMNVVFVHRNFWPVKNTRFIHIVPYEQMLSRSNVRIVFELGSPPFSKISSKSATTESCAEICQYQASTQIQLELDHRAVMLPDIRSCKVQIRWISRPAPPLKFWFTRVFNEEILFLGLAELQSNMN